MMSISRRLTLSLVPLLLISLLLVVQAVSGCMTARNATT